MTIFRSRGFDTLIGKDTTLYGSLVIGTNSTAVIEGQGFLTSITSNEDNSKKTTLHVNGLITNPPDVELNIEVQNVIISGIVSCETIRVEGTLAVKSGAKLNAKKILYRELIIETGAIVHGQMCHLDHVSEGEKT